MKFQIESTNEKTLLQGQSVTLWKGKTEAGTEFFLFVAGLGVPEGSQDQELAEVVRGMANVNDAPKSQQPVKSTLAVSHKDKEVVIVIPPEFKGMVSIPAPEAMRLANLIQFHANAAFSAIAQEN